MEENQNFTENLEKIERKIKASSVYYVDKLKNISIKCNEHN